MAKELLITRVSDSSFKISCSLGTIKKKTLSNDCSYAVADSVEYLCFYSVPNFNGPFFLV